MKNAIIAAALLLTSQLGHAVESAPANPGAANQPIAKSCWKSTAAQGDITQSSFIHPTANNEPKLEIRKTQSGRAI